MKTVYCPDCRTFRQSDVLSDKDWSAAARKAGGYPPVRCGCKSESPPAETPPPVTDGGEDMVERKAILDAYIGSKLASDPGRKRAVPVKALRLRSCPTPWVCSGTSWLGDTGTSTMLPLYRKEEFEAKFPGRKLRLGPDSQDKEGGYYFGVCVRHGGKDHVIGPDVESRKLSSNAKAAVKLAAGKTEKPYGWSMKLYMGDGTMFDFHCVASTEKTARRLALRKRGVREFEGELTSYTREEYGRVYGTKRGRA